MIGYTSHVDRFVLNNLPPEQEWPDRIHLDQFPYPERLNCAAELLDGRVLAEDGDRVVFRTPTQRWTYGDLFEASNRIAHVLVDDFNLVPGNRVLIRSLNNPMQVACWFAVAKAGGIVVATMSLERAHEISTILEKAQIKLALCDERLADEMEAGQRQAPVCEDICYFNGSGKPEAGADLEFRMAKKETEFRNVATAGDDPVLIAFTSGTTGVPKAAVHFHRSALIAGDACSRYLFQATADDIFISNLSIGFVFGLDVLVFFPMRVGASSVLLEETKPQVLLRGMQDFKATICVTVPTAYRMMLDQAESMDLKGLRLCLAGGEPLPLATCEAWKEATGVALRNGFGTTELLHMCLSSPQDALRPGSIGKPVPGYEARVIDEKGTQLPPEEIGRLAMRGPIGCLYLADPRQRDYVEGGWNITGDLCRQDADGYLWFEVRADDMIISGGHNISGPEVEGALQEHKAVAQCAVVAAPDEMRGNIVKAFVVVREGYEPGDALIAELQAFVKSRMAPYKYPRKVEFVDSLPETKTGKVQRSQLRKREIA